MKKDPSGRRTSLPVIIFLVSIVVIYVLIWTYPRWLPNPAPLPPREVVTIPGGQILAALEQYRSDHGRYPNTLEKLVPKYVKEVPKPQWGVGEWEYGGGEKFGLSVLRRKNDYECYYWRQDKNEWGYDG